MAKRSRYAHPLSLSVDSVIHRWRRQTFGASKAPKSAVRHIAGAETGLSSRSAVPFIAAVQPDAPERQRRPSSGHAETEFPWLPPTIVVISATTCLVPQVAGFNVISTAANATSHFAPLPEGSRGNGFSFFPGRAA
jgi:hypothetical protein